VPASRQFVVVCVGQDSLCWFVSDFTTHSGVSDFGQKNNPTPEGVRLLIF
jgi:hypothetical protein